MIEPEHVIELLRAEGRDVTVTEPGQVLEDADGIPAWIVEGETTTAMLGAPALTSAEWEATARWLLGALEIYCPNVDLLADWTSKEN